MAWMTAEAAVAVAAGIAASSIALIGFGLDSVIEFAGAAVVVRQLRGGEHERESRAVRFMGVAFLALALHRTHSRQRQRRACGCPGPCPCAALPALVTADHCIAAGRPPLTAPAYPYYPTDIRR
jgi:hypothetical protein